MSCELKTLAVIDDLASTRTALQLDNVDAWLQTVFCATTPAALNASVAAASASTSAVLCLATATRYALLRGHWDAAAQRQRYHLEHSGTLLAEPDEHITAIALLPIAAFGGSGGSNSGSSASSSSSSDLDWTCLAFGLSSGTVRFCTTSGTVLAIQQWHPTEPVHQLKVQSASRSAGLADELHVFHSTCVCSVAAGPLVQLLRNRNSSARTENIELYAGLVPARRWQYGGRPGASATSPQITDAICAGPQPLAGFDHLLAASREGGFYAQYKSCPPQSALVLAVGARPYAGFHWAREGVAAPVLADVARAVARHIKSALPTWLTGSASSVTGPSGTSGTAQAGDSATGVAPLPPPPTAEPMQLRFGLCDLQRVALAVWLAPDRRHAAVADNLGRVILVDLRSAVAVRVWKGYRDAQCGFVQANEKLKQPADRSSQERRRHAMFLVIYAPKRACLECWLLQRGPRVAAFAVSKRGRLLSTCGAATQALGISTAAHSGRGGRSARPAGSQLPGCVFVDAQSGEMRELCVPFHCALSDEYARTSKDLHLLRRIKLCVRNGAEQPEHGADEAQVLQEVLTCCEALQTDEVRVKCVEQLVRNTKCRPQVLQVALRALLEQQQRIADEAEVAAAEEVSRQEVSPHTERLLQLATDYQGLVELYLFLNDQPAADDDSHPSTDIQLSLTELENIEQFVTLKVLESGGSASAKPTPKVHFNVTTKSIGFADYLAIFHSTEAGPRLRDDLADSALSAIGELIFERFIERGRRPAGLEAAARSSGASSSDLMRMLLAYWLDRRFEYTRAEAVSEHLQRFAGCARAICRLAGPEATVRSYNEYNAISDWWQAVREQLLVAGGAVQAWLAAMMCRALAERLSREEAAAREDEDGAEEVWEQVPQEAAEWSLLVDKLDDVAVLALALGSSLRSMDQAGSDPNCSDDSMSGIGGANADDDASVLQPLVPMPVLPFGEMDVSLAAVVRGGRGIVTDLVAKWIISLAVAPEQLCVFDADASGDERSGSSRHDTSAESDAAGDQHRAPVPAPASTPAGALSSPSAQTFSHYWQFLRGRFPFSLQSGAVLAHMAWEYFCHWSKHMAQMQLLQAGLRCLAAMRRPRDQRLRHGLCCMIWNAHLKIPLQATSKLVNKTGRLPTEALCMQDIGLSASLVADLLLLSAEFWGHFRESATMDGQTEVVKTTLQLRHEELLQDGPVALAQLAVEQPPATPALLELHAQLLQVLYVMAALNLRIPRPVQAVFDAVSVLALFSEINRPAHQPRLPPADAVLERKRTEFLLLVVSATMDLIREDHDGGVFVAEHVGWMARVQKLCEAWGLSADELRRHQVAELYAHGWDGCAERQLEAVLDVRAMGEVLLRIAGRRLNALLKNRPRMYVEVASVGSVVTDFLDILHNSRDRFERASRISVTLEALTELAIRAFTCLADSEGREKRIAAQLYDACQRLREQQELLGAESEK